MKKCPKCGSGGELINGVEFYAGNAAAFGAAAVVGFFAGFANPHWAHPAAHEAKNNLTKNMHKKYRCTNPKCEHVWEQD